MYPQFVIIDLRRLCSYDAREIGQYCCIWIILCGNFCPTGGCGLKYNCGRPTVNKKWDWRSFTVCKKQHITLWSNSKIECEKFYIKMVSFDDTVNTAGSLCWRRSMIWPANNIPVHCYQAWILGWLDFYFFSNFDMSTYVAYKHSYGPKIWLPNSLFLIWPEWPFYKFKVA